MTLAHALVCVIGAGTIGLAVSTDVITGDDSNNHINANSDPASTDGDDTINAMGGNDNVQGLGGNDTIDGGDGDDALSGGPGDDTIHGGNGEDGIRGDDGSDTLHGDAGNDTITADGYGHNGNDQVFGGEGDDNIQGGNGDDTLDGGPGLDEINGGQGADTINGGPDRDIIDGGGGDDLIHGDGGNDELSGNQGRDRIWGDGGDDLLQGRGEFDYLDGGPGADTIDGGSHSDLIIGRDGDDTLIAGPEDDYIAIIGNSVDGYTIYDSVHANGTPTDTGADMLCFVTDVNPDQLTYATHDGEVFLEFNEGLWTSQPVTLDLNNEPDVHFIEAVRTGAGNDVITGTDLEGHDSYWRRFAKAGAPWMEFDELFFTGGGNDTINTGAGDDFIDAGEGNDTINAGGGDCYILTGPGADTVVFNAQDFDGQHHVSRVRCRVGDLTPEDTVRITGVSPGDVTLRQWLWDDEAGSQHHTTSIVVAEEDQIDLVGILSARVQVTAAQGGVEIRATAGAPQGTPEGPKTGAPR